MDGMDPVFANLTTSFDGTLSEMNLSVDNQMSQMDMTVQTGFTGMVTDAGNFRSDFKGEIDQTDLYPSGVNIMQGLNNGLISMRTTVIRTAQGIGADVKNAVNGSLDIHSPSGVMEESGENTDLGLVKGMRNMAGRIEKTAQGIADKAARGMSPMRSRYSPDSPVSAVSQTPSEVNNYSPVFNLTLNGASATDSNERKVKRWVREAMKEAREGMGRTNPRLQEV